MSVDVFLLLIVTCHLLLLLLLLLLLVTADTILSARIHFVHKNIFPKYKAEGGKINVSEIYII